MVYSYKWGVILPDLEKWDGTESCRTNSGCFFLSLRVITRGYRNPWENAKARRQRCTEKSLRVDHHCFYLKGFPCKSFILQLSSFRWRNHGPLLVGAWGWNQHQPDNALVQQIAIQTYASCCENSAVFKIPLSFHCTILNPGWFRTGFPVLGWW